MLFGNPLELFLLAQICFVRLVVFSVSACLVFIASSERKIGLLPSMAIHIMVTTCDACAADHVVRFTRPSPSVFAYCKRSKTGAGEGLGTRLVKRAIYLHSFVTRNWDSKTRKHVTVEYLHVIQMEPLFTVLSERQGQSSVQCCISLCTQQSQSAGKFFSQ